MGGGTLFFGGDSISAAVDQAAVLKKVVESGNTDGLTEEEKTWFDGFFSGKTLQSGEKALQSGERALSSTDKVLTPEEYSWVVNAKQYITKNDNMLVAGTDNYVLQSGFGFGNIVGYKNYTNKSSYVFGQNNTSIGDYGVAIGYQNGIIGYAGIVMGNTSVTGAGGIAIGSWALSHNLSIALGRETLATGESSLAIGDGASAGTSSAIDIYRNSDEGLGNGWTTNQPFVELQKDYPNIFGSYDENQDSSERDREVQQKIFDLKKDLFEKQGINSLDELLSKAKKYNTTDTATAEYEVESILSQLGWQYAMTQENVTAPIALGKESKAFVDNGVALGAYSAVTKADMDEVNSSLKDKAPFSGITLRQSGNLGSDGNANDEYLTGAISIGGPRYVQKDVNGKKQTVQEGNYVRQIKHLADGTDPMDAVNLRQLQAAVKGSGNTDNGGNTGGDTGNSAPSLSLEAGDNITITDKIGESNTKVISATGITDIKNQVTDLNGRVDKVEDSMNTMNHRITKLDRRVDKVGAGAAALAALHPLDFDPDNKWDIAGGYGHYAGQSAMALGAYYRPNEDVMFSIGGAFGNGEDMINAGVSVKVGSGESKTTTSKAAMAKKINELQQVVTTQYQQLEEQKANMAKQDAKIAAQENEIQELKAIMQQILAK